VGGEGATGLLGAKEQPQSEEGRRPARLSGFAEKGGGKERDGKRKRPVAGRGKHACLLVTVVYQEKRRAVAFCVYSLSFSGECGGAGRG